MKLENRIAIVTGGAKGMGSAITRTLGREGADIMLAARDTGPLEEVAEEVRAMGRRVESISTDVTIPAQVAAMVKRTKQSFGGRIDILVNVSGTTGPIETPVQNIDPDTFVFWHDVIGASLMLAWAFLVEGFQPLILLRTDDLQTRYAIWALLYQGLAVAGLCFAIQARLLKRHAASSIAVFSFATPLFGILFAVLLRGDPISPWLFGSGTAIALGIFLVNFEFAPQQSEQNEEIQSSSGESQTQC